MRENISVMGEFKFSLLLWPVVNLLHGGNSYLVDN
jgi:hypothetical protein